jgi:nicotinamide mononucleotide transporter
MMDPVELAGFFLSLAMVYCNIREIHWGWPLAIASSALYGWVFWNSHLYGEAGLQIMFMAAATWGWRQWLKGQSLDPSHAAPAETGAPSVSPLPISHLRGFEKKITVLVTLAAWPFFAFLLHRFTDSDVAMWDGLVTALSLLGQYLLGRKKLENWWVWLLVNVITIALMLQKNLWLTAVLYAVFAVLSYIGFQAWRKQLLVDSP